MTAPGGGSSNYEPITKHALYRAINARLVDRAAIDGARRVADVGGGTGDIAADLLSRWPGTEVVLLDPDPDMLRDAELRLGPAVTYQQAGAEDLATLHPPGSFDALFLGNCIHLVPDIPVALSAARTVLGDGGTLAFNSAFFVGADDRSERHLYVEALLTARRMAGTKGRRSSAPRPLAKRQITVEWLLEELAAAGFTTREPSVDEIELDKGMVLDIVSAPVFASSALPHLAPDEAVRILREAVLVVMERRPDARLTRQWLTVVAR